MGKKIKVNARKGQDESGAFASILQEALSGIKVVKAFSLENIMIDHFTRANLKFYEFTRKLIKYMFLSSPIIEVITSLGIAAVVFFGGSKVMADKIVGA